MIDYEMPKALTDLSIFNKHFKGFCNGFKLKLNSHEILHDNWYDIQKFYDGTIPFAFANEEGACYVILNYNEKTKVSDLPVAIFGRSYGYFIVANNIHELLEILYSDVEPVVNWEHVSYDCEILNYKHSHSYQEYRKWFCQKFAIKPRLPEVIIREAQQNHQANLLKWMSSFEKARINTTTTNYFEDIYFPIKS